MIALDLKGQIFQSYQVKHMIWVLDAQNRKLPTQLMIFPSLSIPLLIMIKIGLDIGCILEKCRLIFDEFFLYRFPI